MLRILVPRCSPASAMPPNPACRGTRFPLTSPPPTPDPLDCLTAPEAPGGHPSATKSGSRVLLPPVTWAHTPTRSPMTRITWGLLAVDSTMAQSDLEKWARVDSLCPT